MFFTMRYSLRKSRHILKGVYSWYKKKGAQLSQNVLESVEREMADLDAALLAKNRAAAELIARRLEVFSAQYCKKNAFEYLWELALALIFALIIAVVIRQMWFEPMEIPTGSMRPTFLEQDHLTVTKVSFGINKPMMTEHLYFDPDLVQRTSIFIFSGDQLPMIDTDTTYFGIFPYKKRYVKRCMGKPGDSVYFYGGHIYGVDKDGNDLAELRNSPWLENLEHVPFLSFEGETSQLPNQTILLKQMNHLAGKLSFNALGESSAEVFNGKKWVKDQPSAQATPHKTIKTYSDFLGIRNYAAARLLDKDELKVMSMDTTHLEEGVLYLQLHHTPSLSYPTPLIYRGGYVGIPAYSTIIPLQQDHLDALMSHMYTSRFVIENGKARSYGDDRTSANTLSPTFASVADGTYEFYYGKAFQIHWGGISLEVPKENPLYSHRPENVQKLFNMGMEMNLLFSPSPRNKTLFPHRYAYFRDGSLFLMGGKILDKSDKALIAFHKNEESRQEKSSLQEPYVAFKDYGPPMVDGKIDVDFIRTFGITIPDKHYLALGDNHARSSDSRVFGFIPQENLQGAPCLIFWPPGKQLGSPEQKPYPFMNIPRAIVWGSALMIFLSWYMWRRKENSRAIYVQRKKH